MEQNTGMNHHRALGAVTLLAFSTAALWGSPCRAALGGDAASVALDRSALHGDLSATIAPHFHIQEITNLDGMRVREYLDDRGTVFAVTWSGPAIPDLRQLFGVYFDEYQAALRNFKPVGLHRSIRIAGPSIEVELSGHMRAYSGRAYLAARVPAETSIGDLR
jgi:hypothetical protein